MSACYFLDRWCLPTPTTPSWLVENNTIFCSVDARRCDFAPRGDTLLRSRWGMRGANQKTLRVCSVRRPLIQRHGVQGNASVWCKGWLQSWWWWWGGRKGRNRFNTRLLSFDDRINTAPSSRLAKPTEPRAGGEPTLAKSQTGPYHLSAGGHRQLAPHGTV